MKKKSSNLLARSIGGNGFGYFVLFLIVVLLWHTLTVVGDFQAFILPGPKLVAARFWQAISSGRLFYHFSVTMIEILSGLLLGTGFAAGLGYILSKSKRLEYFLSPILVASQSIPVVAIAPIIVIWFGPGIFSKILVCAIIIFFPILINTVAGLNAIPNELRDLMFTLDAGPGKILKTLEIPAAFPYFLTGLRVGATLSVTGAVVGEFLGADKGLGFLINVARGQYDTAFVFVIIIVLILTALGLYQAVVLLEKKYAPWKE